ncbi:class I SAM-dependent methyltransferase [Patescibacteria group bacterium]|nr:class I SAM-dependent methyltransferase [Patescibacteria group bacterium]
MHIPQVAPEHYSRKYDAKDRWLAYWYQASLVLRTAPKNVIEIGGGNNTVRQMLQRAHIFMQTVDIDPALQPDMVGSADAIPLPEDAADTVLCAEVLEHLPFDRFPVALAELHRVAKKAVVLSLPHWGVTLRLCFKIPFLRECDFFWKIPWPRRHIWNGEHYWEIGKTGFSPRRIRGSILAAGFTIAEERVFPDDPAHRFYLLGKRRTALPEGPL